MPTLPDLENDADWLPNQVDIKNERVQFAKFSREERQDHEFLAAQKGQGEMWVSISDLLAMKPKTGPIQFIFHSGFCRSTLLLKALTVPGRTIGLNEPEIFNSLARIENLDPAVIKMVIDLLSRSNGEDQMVVVKPSNFPNRLIEPILTQRNSARAILVTNGLHEYLEAIVRKGLIGRQWGRSAYLTAAAYAGDASAFDQLISSMTDLQVSALGWLFMQNWFQSIANGETRERMRVLHSDQFNSHRATTITTAAEFLGVEIDQPDIQRIVDGPVFRTDAKTGVDYDTKQARDTERSSSPITDDEMREVEQWIAELARVSGIKAPIPQTLM